MISMEQPTRPMKDLSMDERRQILFDCQVMESKEVREKWNITNNVLQHIKFFHGKSGAKAGGYYHKDLLEGASDPTIEKIRDLKREEKTSGEIAEILDIPLAKVNKVYASLSITR